jgi:predicted XRE-type DNA-binding protein
MGALIARRGLTQTAAAEVLQIDQPKVSALVRRRLAAFSLDRLVRFLVLLGSDVEIVVKTRTRAMGRARVMVA